MRRRARRKVDLMAISTEDLKTSLGASVRAARQDEAPYRHWQLSAVFPPQVADALADLPFPVPDIEGVSGKRELHNKTRQYFDAENMEKLEVCRVVAEALQAPDTIAMLQKELGVDLEGTYLRIEYAQDTDGFWLEPHTDLGVKKLTFLYYLSDEPGHDTLGTDIYADRDTHVGRSAFGRNLAMIFVPSDRTWHGFEPRKIFGVRKSIIINYVTEDWRAREQLSFPAAPVSAG
jgi:hypothetical protein